MERMLKHQGLHIHRIGPAIKIGIAAAVACVIEVDDITLNAIDFQP
jgi:acyl homoserine lactone synthase